MQPTNFFMTGCASGIGQHLADVLLKRGARVFATDVRLDALEAHANEAAWPAERSKTARLDVRDPGEWARVFAEAVAAFGRIDVAMNIAGVLLPNFVTEATDDEVEAQLAINLKGVILGTRTAAKHMIERGGGHIVNIASMAGVAPIPGMSVYSATKFGVRGYSLAAAFELRARGVAVTAVCPDAVETPLADLCTEREAGAMLFSAHRMLTVEDVARVILGRVLERRPLEALFPTYRRWMARLACLFPSTAPWLMPMLWKRGKAHQHARR